MLVVWEPILPTDWTRPSSSTMARIPDGRVRQFWDPNHRVAAALNEIAKEKPPHPDPDCCWQKGFYWDQVILYPPGARWKDTSAFWNGPVFRAIPGLEKSLADMP